MRLRSPPPSPGGQEQGDVQLGLMMNSVALQSLSTLASLATTLQALPSRHETGQSNVDLIRTPFIMDRMLPVRSEGKITVGAVSPVPRFFEICAANRHDLAHF